jgi:hypothetical protein
MTIDEAIKRLQDELPLAEKKGELYLCAALRLGIEALKAIKELRIDGCYKCPGLLPGETEE